MRYMFNCSHSNSREGGGNVLVGMVDSVVGLGEYGRSKSSSNVGSASDSNMISSSVLWNAGGLAVKDNKEAMASWIWLSSW